MTFNNLISDADAVIFERLAEDATYSGAPIRAFRDRDYFAAGVGDMIDARLVISMRRADVPAPQRGDVITFGPDSYQVLGVVPGTADASIIMVYAA